MTWAFLGSAASLRPMCRLCPLSLLVFSLPLLPPVRAMAAPLTLLWRIRTLVLPRLCCRLACAGLVDSSPASPHHGCRCHKVVLTEAAMSLKRRPLRLLRGGVAGHLLRDLRAAWRRAVRQGRHLHKQSFARLVGSELSQHPKTFWRRVCPLKRSCSRYMGSPAVWHQYLSTLFSQPRPSAQLVANDLAVPLPSLSPQQSASLLHPITADEVSSVL